MNPGVKRLIDEREATLRDTEMLCRLTAALHVAAQREQDARVINGARSLAALAMAMATRLEVARAFAEGEERARASMAFDPDTGRVERRRRVVGTRRGPPPWEYRVGNRWMTAGELSEHVGITYPAMVERLRKARTIDEVFQVPRPLCRLAT